MREIFLAIEDGLRRNNQLALATVVRTWGSSPRGLGSKMVIGPEGEMTGSVSGGCVEGAVVAAGMDVIRLWKPRLLHFGVTNETAWEVGLACGGEIEVFLEPLDQGIFRRLQSAWEAGTPVVRGFPIRGPEEWLGRELIIEARDRDFSKDLLVLLESVNECAKKALIQQSSTCVTLSTASNEVVEVFLDVILPRDTLVIVGGVHIAIYLSKFGKALGYRTIVIDPRDKFANRDRFPDVDEIIQAWPKAAFENLPLTKTTAVAVLTHDPKIDDPALKIVLPSPAFYIGALGSQKTQADRHSRLVEAGVAAADLEKLFGPIGLNLGGNSPAEIALGIMAEIVRVKNRTRNVRQD